MRLESRMRARFSTFSANRCDWISISYAVRRVEHVGYFVRFGHPIAYSFAYFTVKTKAYNVITSRHAQL